MFYTNTMIHIVTQPFSLVNSYTKNNKHMLQTSNIHRQMHVQKNHIFSHTNTNKHIRIWTYECRQVGKHIRQINIIKHSQKSTKTHKIKTHTYTDTPLTHTNTQTHKHTDTHTNTHTHTITHTQTHTHTHINKQTNKNKNAHTNNTYTHK